MWQDEKMWSNSTKNILASDLYSALILTVFLKKNQSSRNYAAALEVIDCQNYKVITKPNKVKAALTDFRNTPFVFFIGKN